MGECRLRGKGYNEAERLALVAADEAQRSGPAKNAEAIKAFELAAWAADGRIEYAEAVQRLRDAEKLTDRTRDPMEWARVQYALACAFHYLGHYGETETILREVLQERDRGLGPDHRDTLVTRHDLALSLDDQGKYAEAEAQFRAVLNIQEKVLGHEDSDTLGTRNSLAGVLKRSGQVR